MKKAREVIASAVCDFMNRPFEGLGRADRKRRLDEADSAIASLSAAGFVILPREPDEGMRKAGNWEYDSCNDEFGDRNEFGPKIYRAMVRHYESKGEAE